MHPYMFMIYKPFCLWFTSLWFLTRGFSGRAGTYTVTNGQVTCIAKEMVLKRKMSESSENGNPEPSTPPAS